jgi:hypothetical protein
LKNLEKTKEEKEQEIKERFEKDKSSNLLAKYNIERNKHLAEKIRIKFKEKTEKKRTL